MPELGKDRLESAEAWGQGVAVALKCAVKLFDQSGGFVLGKVKALSKPDMGSLATLMKRINQREGGEAQGAPTCLR